MLTDRSVCHTGRSRPARELRIPPVRNRLPIGLRIASIGYRLAIRLRLALGTCRAEQSADRCPCGGGEVLSLPGADLVSGEPAEHSASEHASAAVDILRAYGAAVGRGSGAGSQAERGCDTWYLLPG